MLSCCFCLAFPAQAMSLSEPYSKLLKGGYIRDYIGDYYRGYQGGYIRDYIGDYYRGLLIQGDTRSCGHDAPDPTCVL